MNETVTQADLAPNESPAPPPTATTARMLVPERSPALGMSLGALASLGAHVLFALLMLSGVARSPFEEERGAGARDQVWGMSASSSGVEVVALNMEESVANPAEQTQDVLDPVKPTEEVKTEEPAEVPTEDVQPIEEAKTAEAAEAKPVETETLAENAPEEFSPIAGSAEAELPTAAPKPVETIDPVEEPVTKKTPPPEQEIASIEQHASGGPVGVAAGQGGEKADTAGERSSLLTQASSPRIFAATSAIRATRSGSASREWSASPSASARRARCWTRRSLRARVLPLLDAEAIAMVNRAMPFPPLPKGLGRQAMSFTVPARFQP
jgi:periplasmic protein TonB